jgi:ABC-type bacteriocin/lantibiotic exporter with double-glycine peptidase domain
MTPCSKRRFFVPEVVQTSAMDCGPAVLKSLLEGFGIPVDYGRLREACQTGVDGTSIDALGKVAGQLGLAADEVMLPVNHVLLAEADALPAILVVRLPSGNTHFVLVWRRHGPVVQVMDPAVGRRWITRSHLLQEIYAHTQRVPAAGWREWAVSDDFCRPLGRRLRNLGLGRSGAALLIETASAAPGWRPLALLDAATRFVDALVRAGALRRGAQAGGALHALLGAAQGETPKEGRSIPDAYWSVLPAPRGPDGEEQVRLVGAVLVRVRGRFPTGTNPDGATVTLSPELRAALTGPPSQPGRRLLQLLGGNGFLAPLVFTVGLAVTGGSVVLEAVLLRGAIQIGRDLRLVEQRLQAVGYLLVFVGALLLLELWVAGGLARLGRRLEARLRLAFLEKIPRLHDRYCESRPRSDMAERSHAIHKIRLLPRHAGKFVRAAIALGITAAAIAWMDPASAPLAILAAVVAVGLPVACTPLLAGLDLRVRTHTGALSHFYLDVLLGLAAVRAHGADRAVRREHESLLVEWARASRRLLGWVVVIEGLQSLAGFGLAGWLLLRHAGLVSEAGGMLLLAYWALNLPVLGGELALLVRQYPIHRNVTLRLLEPLGAPEERIEHRAKVREILNGQAQPPSKSAPHVSSSTHDPTPGVDITFNCVTICAGGHTILKDIDSHVEAGSQVAIVGASGAGKSTLVGILLGWHRAAAGQVLIDGEPLDAARLERLRNETAWVDPAVQLWNRSLIRNILYGVASSARAIGDVLHEGALVELLPRLPDGLQTRLGEGGGLLSGGEGQRVRFGRALVRAGVRLVILDEPYRGLDRETRRELLRRARRHWQGATLVCITHDVGETRDFERVLVIEAGHVVEDGSPRLLAADPRSRYRALLEAEEAVRAELWSSAIWQRLRLEERHLIDSLLERGK